MHWCAISYCGLSLFSWRTPGQGKSVLAIIKKLSYRLNVSNVSAQNKSITERVERESRKYIVRNMT